MIPEVSVVIATYNRRPMLREAVASVLVQRGVGLELIIVDDGSTDGTWDDLQSGELAQSLRDAPDNCRIITERTANRGAAAARNRGVSLSSAGYIAFLDSDDLWAPSKLSRQLGYMRSHPEYPLAQTQEVWIRNGRRVNAGNRHKKHVGDIFEPSLHLCLISPSAVMIQAGLFSQYGGFDEDLPACEDYDLWLRILCRHQVGLLDEPLVTRRAGHPGQLSSLPALDRYRIRSLIKLLTLEEVADERREAAAEVLAAKCRIFADGLKRRGRPEEAIFYWAVGLDANALRYGMGAVSTDVWLDALKGQPLRVTES